MITVLHLSDIHMGSGLAYGRVNPVTGLNTRLEDFHQTLTRCIDRALAEPVDLVLFGGDAFPDATPPPIVQQMFAQQFHRLAVAKIPTVLLVGNHDQHSQGQGGASLSIYRSLAVPGFTVGDRLTTHRIETSNGAVQVVTLPWLTRSMLLTRPETESLSLSEVHHLLIDRLRVALEGEIRRLDPSMPTILLGHLMVDTARYGAERFLAVSKGFTIPLSLLARPCFDYVALGHVHCHQVLCQQPPVVYPGSIERVDFSEETETKGYVLIHLEPGNPGTIAWEFCPLEVRPFRTLQVNLTQTNQPQEKLLKALRPSAIMGAIVRLVYSLRPDQIEQIDVQVLHRALQSAFSYTIQPELVNPTKQPRLPELATGSHLDPLEALQAYLACREDLADIADELLRTAQHLLTPDRTTTATTATDHGQQLLIEF